MKTWAVIPAKCFDRAKSRLAPVLSAEERRTLATDMFRTVMNAVQRSAAIDGLVVITDCEDVTEVARVRGARVFADVPGGLGASIGAALSRLSSEADAAIVIMGDLPHITVGDVDAMVAMLSYAPAVLAPDREREGTNALALRPPALFPTAFGRYGSFVEHLHRLEAAGVAPAIVTRPGLAFDVDSPDDVKRIGSVFVPETVVA